jgi:prepilin-type processing-associated H-X9-DG protein
LVEVLVVIAIIAVLTIVSFSIAGKMRQSASSAVCVAKMRQIGSGIMLYTQDQGGRLPTSASYGMLFSGQGPWYNRDDRRLQSHIGEYIGAQVATGWSTQAAQMTFDSGFAWPELLRKGQNGSASVTLSSSVKLLINGVSQNGSAWVGSRPSGTGPYRGRMLAQIEEPSKAQAFIEVDQMNTNAGWKNQCPPGPIHGKYRNALYFDWHVGRVPAK